MAKADNPKALPYDEIASRLRTGDILLFHGANEDSIAIEKATGSKYSHVAMAIRPDPAKPPLIWQAGPGPIVKDPKTHTKHGGAQLGRMRDALAFIEDPVYNDTGFWRRMMVRRPEEFEHAAIQAVAEFDGRPFPSLLKMVEHWIEGKLHIVSPEKTLFCAELIALTYMRMGLLPVDKPANGYSPAAFSEERPVDLMLGARFGPPVQMLRPEVPKPATTPTTTN